MRLAPRAALAAAESLAVRTYAAAASAVWVGRTVAVQVGGGLDRLVVFRRLVLLAVLAAVGWGTDVHVFVQQFTTTRTLKP